jgi:hypothetical protein
LSLVELFAWFTMAVKSLADARVATDVRTPTLTSHELRTSAIGTVNAPGSVIHGVGSGASGENETLSRMIGVIRIAA